MPDFNAKMHQNQFRLGLRPRPSWGSLQRSHRPRSCLRGPTSKGGEGGDGRVGEGRGGEEREREEKGREGRGGAYIDLSASSF